MTTIVESSSGVTLVGAGAVEPDRLAQALALAPLLIAADGGADRALALGHEPSAAIGDLDSISPKARARLGATRLHHLAEQETSDFDKALRSISAPFVIALGFSGTRADHTLSGFAALARHARRRCLLMAGSDLCFLAPPELELDLAAGTRLSLFPLGEVAGESAGLRWPIGGLNFAPWGMTGISNEVAGGPVRLRFDAPRMLAILPAEALGAVLSALERGGVQWPVR